MNNGEHNKMEWALSQSITKEYADNAFQIYYMIITKATGLIRHFNDINVKWFPSQ